MEKDSLRVLIAFALCLLIIIYYPRYLQRLTPPAPPSESEEIPITTEEIAPITPKPEPSVITTAPEAPEEEYTITTPLMEVTFSNYEATINKIVLLEYLDQAKNPLELVAPVPITYRPLATTLLQKPTAYKLHAEDYQVIYTATIDGLNIKKTFNLSPNSYLIHVDLSIENQGYKEISFQDGYDVSVGTIFPGEETMAKMYFGTTHLIDADIHRDRISEKRYKDETGEIKLGWGFSVRLPGQIFRSLTDQITHKGNIYWTAVKNKYFCLILEPKTQGIKIKNRIFSIDPGLAGVSSQIAMPNLTIPAGKKHIENFLLYAGPKKYDILKDLGTKIDSLMEFGKLAPVCKITLHILKFLYRIVHNYGVAIILLTILIRFLLYPLTLKSYKSMREMSKIQPLVQELQKKYKNDPKRMQKEMMILYKEHKVNPFGGCLPMVLQLPILIALFTTLRSAIELRGAPFVLWIKDLSEPDLLFRLPNGFSINVLPILLLATFFIQQKMTVMPSTSPQQQQQQKIMSTVFPIFLGFIFYNMPSGLVLYFGLSTLIGIMDQYRIKKKKD